jgi:excisionase family DNA binding protein
VSVDPKDLAQAQERLRTSRALRVVEEERRPFFTPKTLARYLSVSERTVRQMVADRRIESVKVEGVRRIPADDVDSYVARHRVERA